jgi:pseudouridylate synthase
LIIEENKDYLVFYKEAGMDSEKDAPKDCLPIHRLDKVASGLLLYGKNKEAAAALSRQLTEKKIKKRYHIVIQKGEEGKDLPEEGRFQDYLYKDSKKQKCFPVKSLRKGVKEAILRYKILEENGEWMLLDVELETGRFHQIRAQFAGRGFPLYGDGKYGSRQKGTVGLHCYQLSFLDLKTGEERQYEIKNPEGEPWSIFESSTEPKSSTESKSATEPQSSDDRHENSIDKSEE